MNNDDPLDELLARFREIEPPATVRAANRAVVRAALASGVTRGWLSKSVATPLPAVLAATALLLVSLTLNVVLWHDWQAPGDAETRRDVTGVARAIVESRSPAAASISVSEPQFEYSETQRYLSGVGVVDRQASYAIKELP